MYKYLTGTMCVQGSQINFFYEKVQIIFHFRWKVQNFQLSIDQNYQKSGILIVDILAKHIASKDDFWQKIILTLKFYPMQ